MMNNIPVAVLTDSYKATHFRMYPEARRMVAYGEFRAPMKMPKLQDQRMVFYGLRHITENYINRQWTMKDVEMADQFYKTHNVAGTPFPYPRDLFEKFIRENDGYFPVKIEALPEGTVCYPHTPVYQITAVDEYSRLCTFLETIMTMVWYGTTVASLSRYAKEAIRKGFQTSVDDSQMFLLDSRLHDFGFRGCTTVEQSVVGGCAHLLNFSGSDTMSACFHAQFNLNEGKPIGSSIPATEHSVMTSWPTEREAIAHQIQEFGDGLFAVVMDSYDYINALEQVLPSLRAEKVAKGGYMVLRPDSGDPVDMVLTALRNAEKIFGAITNSKGYKVINGCGVIQGDGINYAIVCDILQATLENGYSAQNVAFGMGGGLLQKVNRDTMSFATKLAYIVYADGTARDVMKTPKTDGGKFSLPGVLSVHRDPATGVPMTYPADQAPSGQPNLLQVIYDNRPVPNAFPGTFSDLRQRIEEQFQTMPEVADVIAPPLRQKMNDILRERQH